MHRSLLLITLYGFSNNKKKYYIFHLLTGLYLKPRDCQHILEHLAFINRCQKVNPSSSFNFLTTSVEVASHIFDFSPVLFKLSYHHQQINSQHFYFYLSDTPVALFGSIDLYTIYVVDGKPSRFML